MDEFNIYPNTLHLLVHFAPWNQHTISQQPFNTVCWFYSPMRMVRTTLWSHSIRQRRYKNMFCGFMQARRALTDKQVTRNLAYARASSNVGTLGRNETKQLLFHSTFPRDNHCSSWRAQRKSYVCVYSTSWMMLSDGWSFRLRGVQIPGRWFSLAFGAH